MTFIRGTILCFLICTHSWASVLFQDNFDSQADWTRTQRTDTAESCYSTGCSGWSLPTNWWGYYNGRSFCSGGPGSNGVYVNARPGYPLESSGTCYGGSGKCLTYWDESCTFEFEDSTAELAVDLGSVYDEVYVGFKIKLGKTAGGSTYQIGYTSSDTPQHKLSHAQHYSSGSPFQYFYANEGNQPLVNLQWKVYQGDSRYWPMELIRCYCGDGGGSTCYYCQGSPSYSYDVPNDHDHTQDGVFATEFNDSDWHTIIYRVKTNTSVGSASGEYDQWFDGNLVHSSRNIPFTETGASDNRGFRVVTLGGNNNNRWTSSCSGTSCEQWYAIDDFIVATTYAEAAAGPSGSDTTAPSISVTQGSTVTVRKTRTTTLTGTCSDAVGVSWVKWRVGEAPDGSNGTACTGTTSWSCDITNLGGGSNDIRIGCGDAAGNVGTSMVNVEVTKRTWFH